MGGTPDSGRSRITDLAGRRRRAKVVAPILFFSALFYSWTGTTEKVNPYATGSLAKRTDAYNLLTSAFLKGHLSLLEHAPAGLTSLKDPYDPVQNGYWSGLYHDLALYKGHFFLTWGPTPVVTLLMPWRLLHVGMMPVNIGVVIYCWLGLLFSVGLLCFLVDRYLTDTKLWQLGIATAALALCNVAPFLLRRPDVYELAISSGYCFTMLGIFLLASGGLPQPRKPWRLALGSASIGFAVGARPDLIFEGLLLIAALAYVVRNDHLSRRAEVLRTAGLLLGPFTVLLALLLAYNHARFGSALQNGTIYQLAGYEVSKVPQYQVSALPANLYFYIGAPVRWTIAFPYVALPQPQTYPWHLPAYYKGEITAGLLTTTPIVFASVPAIAVLGRRGLHELRTILLTLLTVGMVTLLFLTMALPGTTMRYEVDYATLFVLPALIGWFVLTSGPRRRAIAMLGTTVIVYGCIVGTAISISGYFDGLRTAHPSMYWALDRLSSPLPTAVTMLLGHPVIARVYPADQVVSGDAGTADPAHAEFELANGRVELDIISPRAGQWSLGSFTPTAAVGSRPVTILVQVDDRKVQNVRVGSGSTGIPLSLHRGLNRIRISATTDAQTAPSAGFVSVTALRLSEH